MRLNVTLKPARERAVGFATDDQVRVRTLRGLQRRAVGESTKIINSKIMAKLRPITDGTHALSDHAPSADPNKTTVLGYEAEGTG